jgi:hypothetical protein
MTLERDQNGILRGDLQYDVGFPATVLSHITPVLYPCTSCGIVTLHVVVEQPTGLAIKIPFVCKPLASTGKDFGLVCNDCTVTAGINGKALLSTLEQRIVPTEICRTLDRFFENVPNAPLAYGDGFAGFLLPHFEGDTTFIATFLSIYRRQK